MADVVNLLKARSMLMILQSICEQTIEVLEACKTTSALSSPTICAR
jgi:hypothetical protein